MPYEFPILQILTVIGVVGGQAIGLWKLLDLRFRRLEEAFNKKIEEQKSEHSQAIEDSMNRTSEINSEIHRIDRDVTALKTRMESIPTKDQMEAMLDKRVDKLEVKFDRLFNAIMRPIGFGRRDDQSS